MGHFWRCRLSVDSFRMYLRQNSHTKSCIKESSTGGVGHPGPQIEETRLSRGVQRACTGWIDDARQGPTKGASENIRGRKNMGCTRNKNGGEGRQRYEEAERYGLNCWRDDSGRRCLCRHNESLPRIVQLSSRVNSMDVLQPRGKGCHVLFLVCVLAQRNSTALWYGPFRLCFSRKWWRNSRRDYSKHHANLPKTMSQRNSRGGCASTEDIRSSISSRMHLSSLYVALSLSWKKL